MKTSIIIAAAAALLTTATAHAGAPAPKIKYQFAGVSGDVFGGFTYTSDGFITSDLSLQASDLDRCSVFTPAFAACTVQDFSTNVFGFAAVTLRSAGTSDTFLFDPGVFLKVGSYDSKFSSPTYFAKLNVSEVAGAVPEPASWALMIIGFGIVGVTARRRMPAALAA